MSVKLSKRLNLVLPLETEKGIIHIHSMPVSREVFEANYLVLSMSFMEIYSKRLGPVMGPRVAYYVLRDQAQILTPKIDPLDRGATLDPDDDIWGKTQRYLIQEIYRLTNVLMPKDKGYETIPYAQVKQQKLIDEDSIMEVENALVYFTVASHLHQRSELPMAYAGLERLWNAQTTASNVTVFMNSLPTLTKEENTGETTPGKEKKASSIPF